MFCSLDPSIKNTDLWEKTEEEGEPVLRLINNDVIDHQGGKVALFSAIFEDYTMKAEMCFLGHHLPEGNGGWFGFVMRAQDTENYELLWFIPLAESKHTVAYLPVAHGIVPWWTEAYRTQEKGEAQIPKDGWFQAEVLVQGDEFTLYIGEKEVFTKKFTYYLSKGHAGFYVGTATDAAFRRAEIRKL